MLLIMSDDNIISIISRIKERKEAADDSWPDPTPIPKPTLSEVDAFLRVLTFIQQQSPDGTGEIAFDNFVAKIAIDGNRLDWDEDNPQIRQAIVTEALFPIAFTAMNEEEKAFEEEVTFNDIVFCAHDIISQLDPDDE